MLWRQGGEGWGPLMSFPQPPISVISSPFNLSILLTQPSPDALDCVIGAGRTGSTEWCEERWDALCSLPLALREGEEEGGGWWLWR